MHGFKDLGDKTSFVNTKREIAWHKLGKVVDEAMTSKEAIELAGLDFTVNIAPVYANVGEVDKDSTKYIPRVIRETFKKNEKIVHSFSRVKPIPNKFCTYREDTNDIFGIVGKKYEVVQNVEAFDFFDSIVGEGIAMFETAGALGNGEQIFMTAKLPSCLEIGKDLIDQYLLLSSSHDGNGSINVLFTPIRVVCNNTLSAAIGSARNIVRIKHTKNARERLEASKAILGIVDSNGNVLKDVFGKFSKSVITDEKFDSLVMKSFGYVPDNRGVFSDIVQKKLDAVTEYYYSGVGQSNLVGTKYGAYNAITGYLQNVEPIKDDGKFFNSTFYGNISKIRQTSFNLLLKD